MASYLQSWALADIIPVLTSESRYKIHPNAPTSITAHVTRAFEAFLLGLGIHLYDSRNNCSGTTEKKGDILDYSAHQLNRWFDDCTSTTNSNSDGPTTAQLIMAQKQQTARQARKRSYSTEDQFFASNRHYRYPPVSNSTGFAPPAPSVVGRSVVYGPNENFSTFQNDASFPAVQVDGGFSCIDLDNANIPARYSLINVATIFDGDRKFGDVIKSLPSRLRVYGVDIAVFLLRYNSYSLLQTFLKVYVC